MINILLVDNHMIFCEGLKCVLENNNLICVPCIASNYLEFIDCIRNYDIDFIILDIDLDNNDGVKILDFINSKHIDVKVIVLTDNDSADYLIKANDFHVDGYLLKRTDSVELVNSIHEIKSGNRYIQPSLIPILNNYLINKDFDREKIESLTSRELEILKMIAIGGKNSEIASKMDISERTVKNHLTHIFDKIDVKDRTQAAVFAIKNDIIRL